MPPRRETPAQIPDAVGATAAFGCAWVRMDSVSERVVLAVGGELDVSGSDALVAAMRSMVASSTPRALTLDLSELTFIDASGVQALLRVEDAASANGCELQLTRPHPMVTRVFEICQLGNHLEPLDDVDLLSDCATSTQPGD